jgi:hypothetical protein
MAGMKACLSLLPMLALAVNLTAAENETNNPAPLKIGT